MTAKELLEDEKFGYDHFTKLTSTGINPDEDNIAQFAEDYHQAKLKLLNIDDVSNQRELLIAFMEYLSELPMGIDDFDQKELLDDFESNL